MKDASKNQPLDPSGIEHVAGLARIRLTREEKEKLGAQLSDILGYMEKLKSAPADDLEQLSHILPLKNVTRPDEPSSPAGSEQYLRLAPEREGGFFKVPPVIEET